MSPETERLIDVLLAEEIGHDEPPDVADHVLGQAFPNRRIPWRWAALAAASLAACVAVAVFVVGHRYPAPIASGSFKLAGAAAVGRGAILSTESGKASLTLGGYCHVNLEPKTSLRIDGKAGAEEVFLEKGHVLCEVNRGVGAFAVQTRSGKVSVVGTSFSVKVVDKPGTANSQPKPILIVAVSQGNVQVEHEGKTVSLAAGSQHVFGDTATASKPSKPTRSYERVTLTGIAKALGNPKEKMNPTTANATLTVDEGSVKIVYQVCGWAGVILATKGDGKKAEVSGIVGEHDGRKMIYGKSSDVKIIIVEEKPATQEPKP